MNPMHIHGDVVPWMTIPDLLQARAHQRGEELRVDIAGTRISWAEIDRLSDRVAGAFKALGVGKGDRVCSMMDGRLEQVLTWFGTVKLGAVWTPLNTALQSHDLSYTLKDAAPKVLVAEAATVPRFEDPVMAPQLPTARFDADAGGAAGFAAFGELLAAPGGSLPDLILGPGDPGVIIYTGGTTGRPKGVVLPHFAFIAAGYRFRDAFDVTAEDHQFSVLPLYHVGGTMLGIVGPLVTDIPTTLDRRFSAARFWQRARSSGATLIDPVGTMLSVLCQAPEHSQDRDHRVRVGVGVTGQIPPTVPTIFQARFGVRLLNLYSLSEAGGVLILYNKQGEKAPHAHGEPGRWADFRVVDSLDQDQESGRIGEIVLRPRLPFTFMSGYHNDPQRTVDCWSNLWLHTGDLGRIGADGLLQFVGRQAHWMRCHGENVSAYEVEEIVSAFPGVAEVVAVGVPAPLGEEEVKVFVIPNGSATLDPAAIIAWCRARLASFKVPRFVEFVDEFPRSSTKREVERHKLRALGNDKSWDARSTAMATPRPAPTADEIIRH
jgi:crotonobetaine/carnitine-CoA ligase